MSYDSHLDNNYRVDGDRIISERNARNEEMLGWLLDLLPMPRTLRIWMAWLAALATALYCLKEFPKVAFDSGEFWFFAVLDLAFVGGAWVFGLMLAPFALYGGAAYGIYLLTHSIGLSLAALIALPFGVARLMAFWENRPQHSPSEASSEIEAPKSWHMNEMTMILVFLGGLLLMHLCFDRYFNKPAPSLASDKTSSAIATLQSPRGNSPTVSVHEAVAPTAEAPPVDGIVEAPATAEQVEPTTEWGVRLLKGQGVPRDYVAAAAAFRRAGNYPRALTNLGWMYALGQGLTRDDKQAVHYFELAAAQGYPNAEDSLGYMYEHGRGVPQDLQAAKQWYQKAAAQGFGKSIANLAALESRTQN